MRMMMGVRIMIVVMMTCNCYDDEGDNDINDEDNGVVNKGDYDEIDDEDATNHTMVLKSN